MSLRWPRPRPLSVMSSAQEKAIFRNKDGDSAASETTLFFLSLVAKSRAISGLFYSLKSHQSELPAGFPIFKLFGKRGKGL